MRKTGLVVLALVVLSLLVVRADEDDPEPPAGSGPQLRKLRGTWTVTRALIRGKESKPPSKSSITYSFDGDKVTYEAGKTKYVSKAKVTTEGKVTVLELTREDTKAVRKVAFKIEKGELYLVSGTSGFGKDK